MEKMKKIIIILIILIVSILILLLLLKNKENIDELTDEEYLEYGEEIVPEKDCNGYIDVSDDNIFYSVVNCVNKYIDIIQYNIDYSIEDNETFIQYDIDKEYLLSIKSERQRLEAIYSLLDEQYKKNNNININNVKNFLYKIREDTILIPLQMKVKYGTNINTYILKTYLNDDELNEKYFIIRINNKNQTFSIELISENLDNIEKIKINENEDIIEKNDYNNFKIEIIGPEKIAQNYLKNYIDLSIQYPEIVYDNYLDKDYRDKRFGTLDNYKKYIEDNKEELEYVQITKYLVENTEENKTKYVCLDQYQNTYVFTVSTVMQYNVTLDTYTIESDKFKNTYTSSDNQNKVMMNVDKFIMMLNNRDYNAAYNLLDDTFRKNKFGSEDVFETYMRNKYPLHYKVEYFSFEERGNNIYIQKVKLSDITNINQNIIEFTIFMRLEEDTNFVMSFEV